MNHTSVPDDRPRPIGEHIGELRRLLLVGISVFTVGAGVTHLYYEQITAYLLEKVPNVELVFLGPLDALLFVLKVDAIGGLIVATPAVVLLVFYFLAPAFNRRNRLLLFGYGLVSIVLTAGGLLYTIQLVLPLTLEVLLNISIPEIQHMLAADRLLSFTILQALFLVLVSQIPLIVLGLAQLGIASPHTLARRRGTIYVGTTAALAIVTPTTDVFTLLMLIGPAALLFEGAVAAARLITT